MNSLKNLITSILRSLGRPVRWFLRQSLVKKILIIIVIGIILLILMARSRPQSSKLTIEKVTRGSVEDVVSESGNVEAAAQFQVFSPATGYMAQLFVKNGDVVTVNQKLFEVKSTATPDQKAQAQANYLQAKSALNSAMATSYSLRSVMYSKWRRYLDLATNGTYQNADLTPNVANRHDAAEFQEAEADWNAAQANYNNQQVTVEGAQASLTAANLAYQATQDRVVNAPIAGTIANLSLGVGDQVSANTSSSTLAVASGVPVLFVGNFSRDIVRIPLNEVDVNKIQTGQNVSLVFDAMRDKKYTGMVETVDTVGTNTAGVITYNASIEITNADTNIKPNMTVTATIETSKHDNVLSVPNSAVKPYKGGKAVLAPGPGSDKKNTLFHYVPVTVGLKGVSSTEITDGVTEGMDVITGGLTTAQLNPSPAPAAN